MIKEKAFIGAPINFEDKFYIYPLKMKDIINNDNIFNYIGLLTQSQEDIDDWYDDHNIEEERLIPFLFLLNNCYYNKAIEQMVKEAFYIFTQQQIVFLYDAKTILIGVSEQSLKHIKDINQIVYLNEDNYFNFQNTLRMSIGEDIIDLPKEDESPLIKQIKAKNRKRERLINKNNKGVSLSTSLAAICCMDLGINPLNIGELSYASFKRLLDMYQRKEGYDLDIKALLAGADSKKVKPKYWISEQSNLIDIQI